MCCNLSLNLTNHEITLLTWKSLVDNQLNRYLDFSLNYILKELFAGVTGSKWFSLISSFCGNS